MTGRIAVLKAYGGDFELREYPVPDPEPGAILVRLTRAGVCGSDLHIWRGEMKEIYGAAPRDLTFGHEMCGRIQRLGAGVTLDSAGQPLGEGDRVTFLYFFPCGRCPVCLRDEMGSYSPWALARALAFLRRNVARFPFERLVSHVFPLARIAEAFREADWRERGGEGLRLSRAALSMTD